LRRTRGGLLAGGIDVKQGMVWPMLARLRPRQSVFSQAGERCWSRWPMCFALVVIGSLKKQGVFVEIAERLSDGFSMLMEPGVTTLAW